jgi:hypothetical protein
VSERETHTESEKGRERETCVCVCVRERESEREGGKERERDTQADGDRDRKISLTQTHIKTDLSRTLFLKGPTATILMRCCTSAIFIFFATRRFNTRALSLKKNLIVEIERSECQGSRTHQVFRAGLHAGAVRGTLTVPLAILLVAVGGCVVLSGNECEGVIAERNSDTDAVVHAHAARGFWLC